MITGGSPGKPPNMTLEAIDNPEKSNFKHLLCLEVNPPRGVDLDSTFEKLDGQLEGIDFLNVTDSALARMRFAPLPFASMVRRPAQPKSGRCTALYAPSGSTSTTA